MKVVLGGFSEPPLNVTRRDTARHSSTAVIPNSRRQPCGSNSSSRSSTVTTPIIVEWSSSSTGNTVKLKSLILRDIWCRSQCGWTWAKCGARDTQGELVSGRAHERCDRGRADRLTVLVHDEDRVQGFGRYPRRANSLEGLGDGRGGRTDTKSGFMRPPAYRRCRRAVDGPSSFGRRVGARGLGVDGPGRSR